MTKKEAAEKVKDNMVGVLVEHEIRLKIFENEKINILTEEGKKKSEDKKKIKEIIKNLKRDLKTVNDYINKL